MTEQLNCTQQVLSDAKKLIEEKGWGQGVDWQPRGNGIPEEDRYCFCLSGALFTVNKGSYMGAGLYLAKAAKEKGFSSYIKFNDYPGRTKKEVLQLIDRAITLAA